MKFSLIICQYNCKEYIHACLEPWVAVRRAIARELNWSLDIYVVDGKFDDFDGSTQNSSDGSLELLKEYADYNEIRLITYQDSLKEHQARNLALEIALKDNPDYIINWGIDEIPNIEEILSMLRYAKENPLYAYFNVNYKNFVFDKQHYVLGFCPPRIFKVNYNGFQLKEFYWDDDVLYVKDGVTVQYKTLPSNTIPKVKVNHYTWCDARSKNKVLYQSQHFANGFGCSFKWDDNTGLSFNMEYYKKIGQSPPEVYVINKNEKD